MPVNFRRKDIRLAAEVYQGRRLYFLTLCFYRRRRFGSSARVARWLIQELRKHSRRAGFVIHSYCIMPDHVHVLALGTNDESDLRAFVEQFKQETGFAFKSKVSQELWQFKYYDHIVRSEESAARVAAYIWMNPVRKGLCVKPQDYAFSGSLTDFGKKMFRSAEATDWIPAWK
jgi:putative transposase